MIILKQNVRTIRKCIALVTFISIYLTVFAQASDDKTNPLPHPIVDNSTDSVPSWTIKTNLLYGAAALAPNLSLEVGLSRRMSLELTVGWNGWNRRGTDKSNKKLAHVIVKPELRYWLCEHSNGHYLGWHILYWRYNIGEYDIPLLFEKEYRYDGHALGTGFSYGYHWKLNRHLGLEFNLGIGIALLKYKKHDCQRCEAPLGVFNKTYFGPTSAAVKLVYKF